jgi:hypothetical protein
MSAPNDIVSCSLQSNNQDLAAKRLNYLAAQGTAPAHNRVAHNCQNLLHISLMMRTPHNSTNKGKRVYVQLKDGTEFVDKFLDKKGHYCFFEQQGKVRRRDIKVFTIYKNRLA